MSVQENAMIVRLSIGQWTARKFDKGVTKDVTGRYDADPDAGRWNKLLVAKDDVAKIGTIASQARDFHYKNTLPWDDVGGRMLPAKNFMEYSQKMRDFRAQFETSWNNFVENRYEVLKADAQARLGKMFLDADYPRKEDLPSKYSFDVAIEPVPNVEDFRVSLQKNEIEKIQAELGGRINDRVNGVTKDLFGRLADVVGKFVERLGDADAVFRDSLVGNVEELVDLLPRLNLMDDPELTKISNDVKKKVLVYDPATLRKDKKVRKAAVQDAEAILKKMSGYLGK